MRSIESQVLMRVSAAHLLAFSLALLPWIAGPAPADPPLHRRVLIISVDGTRPDSLEAANTPNLDALRDGAAFSMEAQTGDVPISGPSYSSMFTGVWRDKHGVHDNDFDGAQFDLYPIFFCRLKAVDPAFVTQSIVRWAPLDPNLIRCADYHTAPSTDAIAAEQAVNLLNTTDPDALFVHFEDPDTAGHKYTFSPTSAGYLAAIEATDARVGSILGALRARPNFALEDWLIFAISDHGGSGTDHHADTPENRTIFMILNGSAVVPGEIDPPPGIVDVAATAMVFLGLTIDPAWSLDGQVIGLSTEPESLQRPADCNQDGLLDISDAVCLLGLLFLADGDLPCGDGTFSGPNVTLLDSNGDGDVDISDPVYVLVSLFAGGLPPVLGMDCVSVPGCPSVCVR